MLKAAKRDGKVFYTAYRVWLQRNSQQREVTWGYYDLRSAANFVAVAECNRIKREAVEQGVVERRPFGYYDTDWHVKEITIETGEDAMGWPSSREEAIDAHKEREEATFKEKTTIANEADVNPTPTSGTDPWAHRSIGMRCRTCMWFVLKQGAGTPVGRCRRHAPTMNGYPAAFETDWCGDHKLDENKL